jgi:hypothetical protein
MIKRTLVCVALCGLMASGSLQAHSLAGVFDMKKDMELSGAVESVKFVNPHGLQISVTSVVLEKAVKSDDEFSTVLMLLVLHYPDTLERLRRIASPDPVRRRRTR